VQPFADHRGTDAMSIAFCVRRIMVAGSRLPRAARAVSAPNSFNAICCDDSTSLIAHASTDRARAQ
jgi:hypothetical protein